MGELLRSGACGAIIVPERTKFNNSLSKEHSFVKQPHADPKINMGAVLAALWARRRVGARVSRLKALIECPARGRLMDIVCKQVSRHPALEGRLQMERHVRELALFNLGIDSKLRGCDLVSLKVRDVCHGDQLATRAIVM
jgi:hypothetical protein